jgi:hypothetical protein
VLDIEPDQVDSVRFERAIRDGRAALDAGQPDRAARLLREGLQRWEGDAFDDVPGDAAAQEARRLNKLRLEALELRIAADIQLGRHRDIVDELEQLVDQEPLREPLTEYLMLALYRCGRQAEALAKYHETRHHLDNQLGLAPGPALQRLQQRILVQDPNLDPPPPPDLPHLDIHRDQIQPAAADSIDKPRYADRQPGWTRRKSVLVTAGTAAAVLVVAAGAWRWTSTHPGTPDAHAATPAMRVFNEFDLAVKPGMGYDLDIPPGKPADWHATYQYGSPDYRYLDLYRTSTSANQDQISGVDLDNTNEFNPIYLVNPADTPGICPQLPPQTGGLVALHDLTTGARVCIRTHDRRWAMLTIKRMPGSRAEILILHITVINP